MTNLLRTLPIVCLFEMISAAAYGDFIANGDFSAGNTGFTTEYNFVPEGLSFTPGDYTIRTDPHLFNTNLASFGDHTTGTGNMLIVDGSFSGTATVWSQQIEVAVNTKYEFALWAASTYAAAPSLLQFQANGETLGANLQLSSTPGLWQEFTAIWYSGANTLLTLTIVDLNSIGLGNDFALDDLLFSKVIQPASTPAPASIVMALSAVPLGLWLARRRQRGQRPA